MQFISTLTQHYTRSVVTCVAHDLERKIPIGRLHNGCGNDCLHESIEGYETFLAEVEWVSLASRFVKALAIWEKSLMNLSLLDFPPNTTHEMCCNMPYLVAIAAIATNLFHKKCSYMSRCISL